MLQDWALKPRGNQIINIWLLRPSIQVYCVITWTKYK